MKQTIIYGRVRNDNVSRETVLTVRGDNLIVRRIRRKITMSEAFKTKYPEASVVDYTRHAQMLLSWAESIDYDLVCPKTVPMVSIIYQGHRYFYNKVSSQWWDLPMLKYWNSRLSDVHTHDEQRKLEVSLCGDVARNCGYILFSQTIVDSDVKDQHVRVFINNVQRFNRNIELLEDALIVGSISRVIPVFKLDELKPDDIIAVMVNGKLMYYVNHSVRGLENIPGIYIAKSLSRFEEHIGEPYIFKENLLGEFHELSRIPRD